MSADPPMSPHFQQAVEQLADARPPIAALPIYSAQGLKLIDKGGQVDQKLYQRLTRHALATPLQDALVAQDSISGRLLRASAEQLIERHPFLACMLDKPALRAMLLDSLETLPLPAPVAFQLSVARDVHPALFDYSVCTALTAGWLATAQAALRYDVSMVQAAGLLQDLGMMHVDPVLLQPEGTLTGEQRRQLYSHPLVSALLLERHHEYPRELIRAVREHHEMLDGSGYPAGLGGDKISQWGRILSLAQAVSAMLRPGGRLSALRLSLLLRTNRQQFDLALGDRILAVVHRLGKDAPPASPTEMASMQPVDAPVARLIAMDALLAEWPAGLATDATLAPARRACIVTLGQQCGQMRRLLAGAGASAEQLVQLGEDFDDAALLAELSLIVHEMTWQLRTFTRQASRLWALAPGEPEPAPLQAWMQQAQACMGDTVES